MPEWRNGIRSGLKISRPQGLTSSSLVSGTLKKQRIRRRLPSSWSFGGIGFVPNVHQVADLLSSAPVSRLLSLMSNRQHVHGVGGQTVVDAEGQPGQHVPVLAQRQWPDFRTKHYPLDSGVNSADEFAPETTPRHFVSASGFLELAQGGIVDSKVLTGAHAARREACRE